MFGLSEHLRRANDVFRTTLEPLGTGAAAGVLVGLAAVGSAAAVSMPVELRLSRNASSERGSLIVEEHVEVPLVGWQSFGTHSSKA